MTSSSTSANIDDGDTNVKINGGKIKSKIDGDVVKIKTDSGNNEDKLNNGETEELETIGRKLNLMLHDVTVNKKIAEQNRNVVQSSRTTARENIRKLRVEVNNFFNKLENAVDKKIEQMRSDDFQTLAVISSECQDLNKKIVIISNYIDKHVKEGKPIDDIETVRKEMLHLETSIRKLSTENTVHEYTFETGDEIHDMFKKVKRLGNLFEETEKKRTVIRMSEMRLNDKCEKETLIPFLSGLIFVSENSLVAADYENRCVKMINVADDKIISVLPMMTEPWDVAKVKTDQIAVTLPLKKKIQFLNVKSDSLFKDHEIEVKGECHGIDSRNGKLYVTFVGPAKLDLMDLHGHVLKSFELDELGYELFSWPGYVALGPEKTESAFIYVTDKDRSTVTCLNEDGKVEAIYGGDNLKGPRGISIDKDGHVFVCGRASNDLCQIMLSNGKVEFLIERSQGLKQPHGIVCHGNRVFISSCGEKLIKSWEIV